MNIFVSELIGAVVQVILFSLIPLVWWMVTARKKENFFKWIGFKKISFEDQLSKLVIITIGVIAIYSIVSMMITGRYAEGVTTAGSDFAGKGIAAFPAVLAYGYIRTGLSEEIVFRGFLLERIGGKLGYKAGIVIQAVLFGALHGIPFGIATHNFIVAIILTVVPGIMGWYFGWLDKEKCNGSIIPSWLIHGTINVIVACLAL